MEALTPQVDDVDLRIRQAEELTRLRKERGLVKLQNQLAEEQRLLANSHNAQPISHTIHRPPPNPRTSSVATPSFPSSEIHHRD